MNKQLLNFCVVTLMILSVQPAHAIRTRSRVVVHEETSESYDMPQVKRHASYKPVFFEEEVEKPDHFWNSFRKVAGGVVGFCFGCWAVNAVSKVFC